MIIGYTGNLSELEIPDTEDGYPVTAVGDYAFYGTNTVSVVIPDSVTSLGNHAFFECSSLSLITIPDSVTSIGNRAFYSCYSLNSIEIPDSVTSIGHSAFKNCTGLEQIAIPDGVTSIEHSAFINCIKLEQITIPNSVTCIESKTFSGCTGLTNIIIPAGVEFIEDNAFNGCSRLTRMDIPDSVRTFYDSSFEGCSSLYDIYFKGTEEQWDAIVKYEDWNSGTPEDMRIHFDYTVEYETPDFVFPSNLTTVEDYAFESAAMSVVYIPDQCTSIGEYAFKDCKKLRQIRVPDNCSISLHAFDGCETVYIFSTAGSRAETFCENNQNCLFVLEVPEELPVR